MINGAVGRGVLILSAYLAACFPCLILIGFLLVPIAWAWGHRGRRAVGRPPEPPAPRDGARLGPRKESLMSSLPSDITVPGRPEVHEVSAGVYAYIQPDGTWWINNTGFLTGPQGVISIDACATHRRTRAYQAAIAAITPAAVRTVVNTHHHGDHTFGNCLFPAAAIVGHESTRAEAFAFGPPRDLGTLGRPRLGRADPRPALRHVHRRDRRARW